MFRKKKTLRERLKDGLQHGDWSPTKFDTSKCLSAITAIAAGAVVIAGKKAETGEKETRAEIEAAYEKGKNKQSEQ